MGLLDAKQNCDHQGHEEAKDNDAPLKQPAIAERRSSSESGNIRVSGHDVLLSGTPAERRFAMAGTGIREQ